MGTYVEMSWKKKTSFNPDYPDYNFLQKSIFPFDAVFINWNNEYEWKRGLYYRFPILNLKVYILSEGK